MDKAIFRDYLLSKPSATSDFPFDEETEVFRVAGKIFALMSVTGSPAKVNLKCDPELAPDLRHEFADIQPGYHMNKRHWNTVTVEGNLSEDRLRWLADHSWEQVVSGLPFKTRRQLGLHFPTSHKE